MCLFLVNAFDISFFDKYNVLCLEIFELDVTNVFALHICLDTFVIKRDPIIKSLLKIL